MSKPALQQMFIGKVQAADLPANVRIHLYPNEKAGVWSTLVAVASLTFYVVRGRRNKKKRLSVF